MSSVSMALRKLRSFRVFEPGMYAVLAAALISPIFVADGVVTVREITLLMAGVVSGLLASCAAAPLAALVGYLRGTRTQWTARTAEILPLVRRNRDVRTGDDTRRAA